MEIRFQLAGLTMLRMAALYVPKQLWRRKNVDEAAAVWAEGIATFRVSKDGQVGRKQEPKPFLKRFCKKLSKILPFLFGLHFWDLQSKTL